jgi:hypothetical protein
MRKAQFRMIKKDGETNENAESANQNHPKKSTNIIYIIIGEIIISFMNRPLEFLITEYRSQKLNEIANLEKLKN